MMMGPKPFVSLWNEGYNNPETVDTQSDDTGFPVCDEYQWQGASNGCLEHSGKKNPVPMRTVSVIFARLQVCE
jgi:hypothetical protein